VRPNPSGLRRNSLGVVGDRHPILFYIRALARASSYGRSVMADRVSASITIGGAVTCDQYQALCALISDEALCVE
jgi:hypothetical protein